MAQASQVTDATRRFEAAFRRIEGYLSTIVGNTTYVTFSRLIEDAGDRNPIVRRSRRMLRKFADLRNLLAHENRDLAIPSVTAVQQIEGLAELLQNPPKLISLFSMEVITCNPTDSVGKAARIMQDHEFSQIPIVDDRGLVDLLTTETIVRWLATRLESDGILECEPIESVLPYRESDSIYRVLPRTATVFDALRLFDKTLHSGKTLDAILLTHSGDNKERLLGIVTPFDIPRMLHETRLNAN